MTDQEVLDKFFAQAAPTLAEERSSELRYLLMQHIVRACRAKGWTMARLAEELGVHPSQVSRFLTGTANPTLDTIAKYEAALGTPILEVNRDDSFAFPKRDLPARPPAAMHGVSISLDDFAAEDLRRAAGYERSAPSWAREGASADDRPALEHLMAA